MTVIDETTNEYAPVPVIEQWIEETKQNQQDFNEWLIDNPRKAMTEQFKKEMKEERMKQFRGDGGSDVRNLSFKIPAALWHADPDFWRNELENKKQFKSKYPFFVV